MTAKEVQLIAVKELMSVLVVQHGYEATQLYDLADEVLYTLHKSHRERPRDPEPYNEPVDGDDY